MGVCEQRKRREWNNNNLLKNFKNEYFKKRTFLYDSVTGNLSSTFKSLNSIPSTVNNKAKEKENIKTN